MRILVLVGVAALAGTTTEALNQSAQLQSLEKANALPTGLDELEAYRHKYKN
jgi:hypothetical protein